MRLMRADADVVDVLFVEKVLVNVDVRCWMMVKFVEKEGAS